MKTPFTVGGLCQKLGMSRQNYYKSRRKRQRREADSGLAEQLVRAERAVQPRLGGRKLFHILGPKLAEAKELYKRRNEVERMFRWLKAFRRIATRYDKLDLMFSAFIYLALCIIISCSLSFLCVNTP
jgi:transposase